MIDEQGMVAKNPLLSLILYNNCVFIVHCMVWLQEIPLLLLMLYNICGKYSSLQARFDFAPCNGHSGGGAGQQPEADTSQEYTRASAAQ